jgi:hypothetical protein
VIIVLLLLLNQVGGKPSTSEVLRDDPVADRLVAIYEAGRSLNKIWGHVFFQGSGDTPADEVRAATIASDDTRSLPPLSEGL